MDEDIITIRLDFSKTSLSPHQLVSSLRTLLRESVRVTSITDKQVISAGMHRPVCFECHKELRPEKNGVGVLDLADFGPYQLWDADLWKCPECGIQVIGGFGNGPISSHYEEDFDRRVKDYQERALLVNNEG